MDKRDKNTWVTLELTRAGELLALKGGLADRLRRDLGVGPEYEVFVPYASYTKNGRTVNVSLIEGYAFVSSGLVETAYFALERKALVNRVFSTRPRNGIRTLQTIPDSKIREMQDRLRDIICSEVEEGSEVRITGGTYARLEGVVVDTYDDRVAVQISLRSIQIIAVVPKSSVESLDSPGDLYAPSGEGFEPLEI